MKLSKFDFDVLHPAEIKHQAADVSLHLNTSGKDESPLENGFPLYATDDSDSLPVSVHAFAQNHARALSNTKSSSDRSKYDPPTTVKKKQTQQQETFRRSAGTQVEQRNWKFAMS